LNWLRIGAAGVFGVNGVHISGFVARQSDDENSDFVLYNPKSFLCPIKFGIVKLH
jgi:hypothetical protein